MRIACLCTLNEFSNEWNEEEVLESLFNLLTLLLNLILFYSSEPFNILWRCSYAIMLNYKQGVIGVGESNAFQYDLTVKWNEKA